MSSPLLAHDCVTPEITDEMRAAATAANGDVAGWWHCPDCGSSYYLHNWYLAGRFHVMWSLHERRFKRPTPERKRWWRK